LTLRLSDPNGLAASGVVVSVAGAAQILAEFGDSAVAIAQIERLAQLIRVRIVCAHLQTCRRQLILAAGGKLCVGLRIRRWGAVLFLIDWNDGAVALDALDLGDLSGANQQLVEVGAGRQLLTGALDVDVVGRALLGIDHNGIGPRVDTGHIR